MYVLTPGTKRNPAKRWALPDRLFFGHGACHILAGTYLDAPPLDGFYAERIIPVGDLPGNHVYVTDGRIAFDYHGYSVRMRLLDHHRRGWAARFPGWDCVIERVDFSLLTTVELNARKMLGPDQYLHDPVARARQFLIRVRHKEAAARAASLL